MLKTEKREKNKHQNFLRGENLNIEKKNSWDLV